MNIPILNMMCDVAKIDTSLIDTLFSMFMVFPVGDGMSVANPSIVPSIVIKCQIN